MGITCIRTWALTYPKLRSRYSRRALVLCGLFAAAFSRAAIEVAPQAFSFTDSSALKDTLPHTLKRKKHCDYYTSSSTFSTGFGSSGNDISSTNWMCSGPVTKAEAEEIFMSTPRFLEDCPPDLLPQEWVGVTGSMRAMCGIHQLVSGSSLLSFGSNGDFTFEDSVLKIRNDLAVYVFDPTLDAKHEIRKIGELERAVRHARSKNYSFIQTGLAYRRGTLRMQDALGKQLFEVKVDTLSELLDKTGNAIIGILKIDASGEFEVISQLEDSSFRLGQRVGILNLEVHSYHPQPDGGVANCCYGQSDIDNLMNYVLGQGFILVGYEASGGGCCAEFSFVNPSFFKKQRREKIYPHLRNKC